MTAFHHPVRSAAQQLGQTLNKNIFYMFPRHAEIFPDFSHIESGMGGFDARDYSIFTEYSDMIFDPFGIVLSRSLLWADENSLDVDSALPV
ncbi:hypothetical protein [Paraburkholderia sp. RL17-337-BIB-A]|uniref:hypothetical protein n=1 Tax=Paraburkholderia sp. RL17-337-BIB-A TaxID=3031636 RepID=UPI0038B83248